MLSAILEKTFKHVAVGCFVLATIGTASAEILFSFENDDEPEWFATTLTGEFDDFESELDIVSGVGNTDGENSLQVVGRVGDYVRHAQVDFDIDQVDMMNEAILEEWNLEFDWTVVASENPGASRFWVQLAISHGGWSQIDMFAPDWPEWDPAGPEVQTMHASIPLAEFADQPGYCCADQPLLDGTAGSYQIQFAVGGGTEEGPSRTFYLDNFQLVDPSIVVSLPGDFDRNGVLDAADIDSLTAEVRAGTNNLAFDVTGDNLVNGADRTEWINVLKFTWLGDSNLDGEFNSSDFVRVFTAAEYEDAIVGNSTWATGDWNGDGDFSSGDFVAAFTSAGFEQGPRTAAAAVPEPSCGLMLAFGILPIGMLRRRLRAR
jgi:hypothetical protein